MAKLILYDALERFSIDYPNIKVEIATGAPNQSVEMLHTGEIDMVLLYLPYKLEYNNLQTIECAKKEYIFVMSKKYFEDNNVKISKVEDLNNYSLIIPKKNSAVRNIFDEKFKDNITNFHFEIAQEQMKKEFIMRGMGIGFLIKDEVREELVNGDIVEVKLDEARSEGSIGIISLNDEFSTFATKKLIKYIKENYK